MVEGTLLARQFLKMEVSIFQNCLGVLAGGGVTITIQTGVHIY